MKIAETISRVRNIIKSVKEDAFLTDRFIYSLITKYGYKVLQKEIMLGGMRYSNLYVKIPFVELQEIDKVQVDDCFQTIIYSGCNIMKSKYPLPKTFTLDNGPMIRTVASIDYSKKYYFAHPETYNQIMNVTVNKKWNKNGYYYIDNENYIYVYNDNVNAVLVEGLFLDYSGFISCNNKYQCISADDFIAPFNDYMFAEIESYVLKELSMLLQIPPDQNIDDNKSLTR